MIRQLALATTLLTASTAALAADNNFDRTLSTSGSPTVAVATGSGYIHLRSGSDNQVHVMAHLGSGSIRLHDINGALRAQTGSGDIEASGKIEGDSKVDTGSGSVRLDLGPQAHLNLDASTGSGSIRTQQNLSTQGDLNHHHVTGTLNGGGPTLRINTGSGDIEIR